MDEFDFTKLEIEIQQLCDIFTLLTGSPEPEEEEVAHDQLLSLLEKIISESDDSFDVSKKLSELRNIIQNWDPLENWFFEVPYLKEKFTLIIKEFNPDLILENERKFLEKDKDSSVMLKMDSLNFSANQDIIDQRLLSMEHKMTELMNRDKIEKPKTPISIKETPEVTEFPNFDENELNEEDLLGFNVISPNLSPLSSNLEPPKIVIPPVVPPKKKIVPHPERIKIPFQNTSKIFNIPKENLNEANETYVIAKKIGAEPINIDQLYANSKDPNNGKPSLLNIEFNVQREASVEQNTYKSLSLAYDLLKKKSTNKTMKEEKFQQLLQIESKKHIIEQEIKQLQSDFSLSPRSEYEFHSNIESLNSNHSKLTKEIEEIIKFLKM